MVTGEMTADSAVRAAKGVLQRLLPDHTDAFDLQLIPREEGRDVFEIEGGGNRVTLRGSTGGAIASALGWYLKHHCHAHVSACGRQLNLPHPLPTVAPGQRIATPYHYRYYFNYCTFSYSLAFWDWSRWEQEIDWMALAGINFPLAITGQEAIWQRVYRRLGLDDEQLSRFFAGPAYLAWGWMGNLDGWGGPLPQSWIDGQRDLQHKILTRQRELGMTPVLPAFTGHVPQALRDRFPQARITEMSPWAGNFAPTYMLDPHDPLFQEIGSSFIREQAAEFGTDHYYSCDTFNENSPPSNEPAYLDSVGKALLAAMTAGDPQARWVMQGWMFFFNPDDPDFWGPPQIRALLESAPADRLIMLDLHSESFPLWKKTQAYCGRPWIWNILHNFGGNVTMFGNLEALARDLPEALHSPDRGELVGMGLTPEGIGQNPVVYDLATDLIWRRESPDLPQWLRDYTRRRYGADLPDAHQAWAILNRTVYARPQGTTSVPDTPINVPPRLTAGTARGPHYPLADVAEAWRLLTRCSDSAGPADGYRFDLVDLTRQVLANLAHPLLGAVRQAVEAGDPAAMRQAGDRFLNLILDLDRLLASRPEFLLGRWIERARAWGRTDDQRRLMVRNARMQITQWGDRDSMLRDYARKEWSGLLRDFHHERWRRFFDQLHQTLLSGETFEDEAFQRELRSWEAQWIARDDRYATQPCGDAVELAKELLEKYGPVIDEIAAAERTAPAVAGVEPES